MCRLSWNLGASTSWNPHGLSRPVMGLLYLSLMFIKFRTQDIVLATVVWVYMQGAVQEQVDFFGSGLLDMCSADWWEGRPDDCCFVSVSTAAWAGKLKTCSRKLETTGITLHSTLPTKWNGFVRRKWSLSETKNGVCFSDEPRAGRPGIHAGWGQGWLPSPSKTASRPTKSPLQWVTPVGIKVTEARSYLRPSSAEIKNVPGCTPNPTWLLGLPLNYVIRGMWRRIVKKRR